MKGYIQIGKIGTPHGSDGEMNAVIEERFLEPAIAERWLFVNINGQAIPFYLENIRTGKAFIVKFEDVDSREEAAKLTSCLLLLKGIDIDLEDFDSPFDENDLEFAHMVGFELRDVELGVLGKIKNVIEYPQQELALIERNGKEVLVPLHRELIVEENLEEGYLLMRLPNGLFDL